MRTGRSNSSTNGSSSFRIPLWPSSSLFHVSSASVARAVVMATPVTTTLGNPFPVANPLISLRWFLSPPTPQYLPKASATLCPPNPNELLIAYL